MQRRLLLSKRLHVVSSNWLEDSLEKDQKLPEDSYSLKPNNLEELVSAESGDQESNLDSISSFNQPKEPYMSSPSMDGTKRKGRVTRNINRLVTLPKEEGKTKRGTSSEISSQRRKGGINQLRRVRPRIGNKPAKIYENDSDGNGSDNAENNESCKMIKLSPKMEKNKEGENFESAQQEKVLGQDAGEQSGHGGRESKIHEIGSRSGNSAQKSIDPVQAILREMIPVLGNSKGKSMDHALGDEKSPLQGEKATSAVPGPEDEKPPLDPNSKPEKRKKVSYRDLAGELLKDC